MRFFVLTVVAVVLGLLRSPAGHALAQVAPVSSDTAVCIDRAYQETEAPGDPGQAPLIGSQLELSRLGTEWEVTGRPQESSRPAVSDLLLVAVMQCLSGETPKPSVFRLSQMRIMSSGRFGQARLDAHLMFDQVDFTMDYREPCDPSRTEIVPDGCRWSEVDWGSERPTAKGDLLIPTPRGDVGNPALFLNGRSIEGAVEFRSVRFFGPVLIALSRIDGNILIRDSEFLGPAVITSSELTNSLVLIGNQFHECVILDHVRIDGDLTFLDNRFGGRDPGKACDTGPRTSNYVLAALDTSVSGHIRFVSNEFVADDADLWRSALLRSIVGGRSLEFVDNNFVGLLFLLGSRGEDLKFTSNSSHSSAIFSHNDFGSVTMRDNDFGMQLTVASNQIARDLLVTEGRMHALPAPDAATNGPWLAALVIDNQVGGTMTFSPAQIEWAAAEDVAPWQVAELDLSQNRIGGEGRLLIPRRQEPAGSVPSVQIVRANAVTVGGTLLVGYGSFDHASKTVALDPVVRPDALRDVRDCMPLLPRGATPPLQVDLRNIAVGTLNWQLELGICATRWSGSNIDFADWYAGELKQERPVDIGSPDVDALRAWLGQMDRPNADTKMFVADYLRESGKFWDSLQLRAEGKRLHFDEPGAAQAMAAMASAKPDRPTSATDDASSGSLPSWLPNDRTMQSLVGSVMWLSGYGVMPSRVFIALLAVWVTGWIIYGLAKLARRPQWQEIIAVHASCDRAKAETAWQLGDRAATFIHRPRGAPDRATALARWLAGLFVWNGDRREAPSDVPGFMQFDQDSRPMRFSLWTFSLDATVPVLNLHAYDKYYPCDPMIRLVSKVQRMLGWVFLSILIASAAVLAA
jgi:hypothetical protein